MRNKPELIKDEYSELKREPCPKCGNPQMRVLEVWTDTGHLREEKCFECKHRSSVGFVEWNEG